jgi:SNF family Na+-dependent transporter
MKKAYLLLLAGMLSTAVFAGSKQTVKIDGQVIEKTVSEITFDGDNVVLQYSDNTSDQADMLLVTLSEIRLQQELHALTCIRQQTSCYHNDQKQDEFTNWGTLKGHLFGIYLFLIKFVCPVLIFLVFLNQFGVFG